MYRLDVVKQNFCCHLLFEHFPASVKLFFVALGGYVYYTGMRKLSTTYSVLGAAIGLCLVAVAYAYSLNAHHLTFTFSNFIHLHQQYPMHIAFDLMPIVLGTVLYFLGIKAEKQLNHGNRLREVIKQKTDDLKESNQKLNAIFNSGSDITVLIGLDRKVIAFNRAARAFMLDISGKEFLSVGDDTFNHVSEIAKQGFSISFGIAATGKKIQFIENFRLFKTTLDKKVVWLFIELQPVLNDNGIIEAVSMNIRDITKRKEIEEAIRKQNSQLKKIAWIQSHQIRKPVANILGLVPLFNEENLNGEEKELLYHLKASATELDNYIKEIVREAKPADSDN
jgi:PAS domain-containing protein